MNFDLDAIVASTSATYDVVVGRDGEKPVAWFKVQGPGSEGYNKARREIEVLSIMNAAMNAEKKIDMTSEAGATFVHENSERSRRAIIRHCVIGWSGFTADGEPAEFTSESLDKVLKARPHWTEMLLREIENEANFIVA